MDPNWGCRLAAAHLWAGLWATSQVVPSPAQTPALPSWDPRTQLITLPAWDHQWTPLPAPCCAHHARALQDSAEGRGHGNVPHYFQHRKLWITPLFHVGEPKSLTPQLCYLQHRSYFIVYGGHRLHTIAEWPCKGRGRVSMIFLPGSFLFLISFTATKTCKLFFTSGFQESLTDIKDDDFSPHKTTTKSHSNRVLCY